MLPFLLIIVASLVLFLGPSIWVGYIKKKYSVERDYPGTGGELAYHLIQRFQLPGVQVEMTDVGDHYDPNTKMVRLSRQNFNGKSLTAIATAAHEVGHAIQDASHYAPFYRCEIWVRVGIVGEKIGSVGMILVPVIALLTRAPGAMAMALLIGVIGMGLRVLAHLSTLSVEYDASFNRALPILKAGAYVSVEDLGSAQIILKACALTYVAAALRNVLNFAYWIRVLRH